MSHPKTCSRLTPTSPSPSTWKNCWSMSRTLHSAQTDWSGQVPMESLPFFRSDTAFLALTEAQPPHYPEEFYRVTPVPFARANTGEKAGDTPAQSGYTFP